MNEKKSLLQVIDMYAGPGGLGTGFERHFEVSDAVDWSRDACITYKTNHPSTKVRCMSASAFLHDAIRGDVDGLLLCPDHEGIIGGPPCQDFSMLNQKRDAKSKRADQLGVLIGAIARIKPMFAMIENVRSVPAPIKSAAEKRLRQAGYFVSARVVNAWDYGSVQLRPRWILTACKTRTVYPEPIPAAKRRFAAEILTGERSEITPTPEVLEAIQTIPEGKWTNLPGRSFRAYHVLRTDRPFPCVANPTKLRYIRPDRGGYLSFSELQRAQGFSREYRFFGTSTSRGQQLANAVPVELAERFAAAFVDAL